MSYKFIFISLIFLCAVCIFLVLVTLPYKTSEWLEPKLYSLRSYGVPISSNNSLLDFADFNYVINTDCNTSFLVWIVTSYAGDPSTRSALRRAYGNDELEELGIRRVFLLGTLNDTMQRRTYVSQNALLNEASRFNDIVQGNFVEAYRNLTYKHLMGLTWAANNCVGVRYLMKMDDDIVVNLYEILDLLKSGRIRNDTLTGYVLKNMIPIRERANKWYISKEEYSPVVYPNFLSGWLYITSLDIAKKLVYRSRSYKKYFWIDDVFLTGILRRDSRIKLHSINEFYALDYRYLNCCIEGEKDKLKCEFIIGPNGGDAELQVTFAKFARHCRSECSKRATENSVNATCIAYPSMATILKAGTAQIQPLTFL